MSDPAGLPVYSKPWTSVAEQLSLLESRGLIVTERPAAENTLRHLNYYRFSGYCLAFEDERHRFRNDVTFADVRAAYTFGSSAESVGEIR